MNHSLSLVSSTRTGCFLLQAQLALRLVLYCGELYRAPSCYRLLRVTAGIAYVTQAGQDYILRSGQEMPLDRAADIALVSGAGCEQVTIELFDTQTDQNRVAFLQRTVG